MECVARPWRDEEPFLRRVGIVGLRFQRRRRIGVLSVGEALFVRALYGAGGGAGRVNGKAILSVTASVGHDAAGFAAFPLHSSIASVLGRPAAREWILVLFFTLREIHGTFGFLIRCLGGGTESEASGEGLGGVGASCGSESHAA
jgi:hypothetical protein